MKYQQTTSYNLLSTQNFDSFTILEASEQSTKIPPQSLIQHYNSIKATRKTPPNLFKNNAITQSHNVLKLAKENRRIKTREFHREATMSLLTATSGHSAINNTLFQSLVSSPGSVKNSPNSLLKTASRTISPKPAQRKQKRNKALKPQKKQAVLGERALNIPKSRSRSRSRTHSEKPVESVIRKDMKQLDADLKLKLNERDQLTKENGLRRAEIQAVQNQATVLRNGN